MFLIMLRVGSKRVWLNFPSMNLKIYSGVGPRIIWKWAPTLEGIEVLSKLEGTSILLGVFCVRGLCSRSVKPHGKLVVPARFCHRAGKGFSEVSVLRAG